MEKASSRRSTRRLRVRSVYRDAAALYRWRFARVVGIAVLVLVPVTALEVVVAAVGRHGWASGAGTRALVAVVAVVLAGVGEFTTTLYAGVLDRTVGASRGEGPERRVWSVLRHLPYGRLIGADLVFVGLVIVGSAAFVVPGLLAITLFSIVGPVVLVEDRRILDAFRRCYQLVRPSFWRVTLTVLVPTVVESVLAEELVAAAPRSSLAHELVVECVFTAFVASFVAVLEVQTAYQLIELDAGGSGASPAGQGFRPRKPAS